MMQIKLQYCRAEVVILIYFFFKCTANLSHTKITFKPTTVFLAILGNCILGEK